MEAGFVLADHLWEVVTIALLSMVPTFEGRYAITLGVPLGLPPIFAYLLAFVFSTLPMPFIFWLLKPILRWLYTLPIKPLQKFAAWVERRSIKKGGEVDARGMLGLFLFVALPIPGTGVWTGSAIATLLNMKRSRAMLMIVLGNMVACLIMLLVALGVVHIPFVLSR